jgi:hypothetical protein
VTGKVCFFSLLFEILYVDSSRSRDAEPSGPPKNLKQYLNSLENLKALRGKPEEQRCLYCNDATGVEAAFVSYRPEFGDEIGLAFEMALPRPTFFALEALPAALSIAREKKLSIEVLDDGESRFYEKPSFEDLLQEWRALNSKAVSANGRVLRQGSAENLESMWEFSIVRQDLARRYGRGRVEVPELYPVLHKRSEKVGRMVDWDGLEKVALGESDWVRLVDPPEPLKNGAIYDAEELTLACKPLVRTVPQPIFHYLCDKSKIRGELIERIAALKKMTMRSFQAVELDQLYDEEGIVEEA